MTRNKKAISYARLILVAVYLLCSISQVGAVSEVWKVYYGISSPQANVDSDGDSQSDLEEAKNGTNPFDKNSNFILSAVRYLNQTRMVKWPSVPGKKYQLQVTEYGFVWLDVGEEVDGNGDDIGVFDPITRPLGSGYRILVLDNEQYLPDIRNSLEARDTDNDGRSDWVEWRAGTSIIDPTSKLQIVSIQEESGVELSWPTIKNHTYSIQQWNDGVWEDLAGSFVGTGNTCRYTRQTPAQASIYRVVAHSADSDEDGVSDWEESLLQTDPRHKYTISPTFTDGELVNQYLNTAGEMTMEVVNSVADFNQSMQGMVRIRRKNGFAATTINLTFAGDAVSGQDYVSIPQQVEMPFGETEILIHVQPLSQTSPQKKTLEIGLAPSASYTLSGPSMRSVNFKVENLLNVKDFGAIGDGVANDSAALQAAFDSLGGNTSATGLFFPAGIYRCTTPVGDNTTPRGSYRVLKLGRYHDLQGRDIVLRGESGTTLYSDLGSIRAHIILANASFRSLRVETIRFEQSPALLWATPNSGPNGSDGIAIINVDSRSVEDIVFSNCVFFNCHRAASIYGVGYDLRGKCGRVVFDNCEVLNPYGSNTINGQTAWGGGQQVYLTPWINEAVYENCLFDGGGEDMTDTSLTGGGRMLDGCHFGSPLRLVFRNNVVKRMSVEGVFQTHDSTFMAGTSTSFVMPPPDDTTTVDVQVSAHPSTWVIGETIVLRTPLTPGATAANNFFTIRGFDLSTRTLSISNQGDPENAAEGTTIAAGRTVYLDERAEPTYALIENNIVDGTIPPGGKVFHEQSGIVYSSKSIIRNNIIKNYGRGILSYEEVHTPRHPSAGSSVIRHNLVITRNAQTYPTVVTRGIYIAGGDDYIDQNIVICPVAFRTMGIVSRHTNPILTENYVIADQTLNNGYTSTNRAVGIAQTLTGSGMISKRNSTKGFDVGIGPEQAYQWRSYSLFQHYSQMDQLPVDPVGLSNP